MQQRKTINGLMFRKMILNAAKILEANKQHVDALNVFPVPDGDTGTNMSLTMSSASHEIANCQNNNLDSLANALSKGALRGARGNSGVILSQIFKGMSLVIAEQKEISVKTFAKAIHNGAEVAYKAVTKPKEGTILTVIREMAQHAANISKKSMEIDAFLKSVIDAGEDALQRTPDMLPVLKKAGVIDAGGRGLLVIFTGFYDVVVGVEKEDLVMQFNHDSINEGSVADNFDKFHEEAVDINEIEFAYCTEFFIINLHKKTTNADIDRFREKLMTIGDCVLVIGDLAFVKVHVHTNDPGNALQSALELGEIDKIKIENMLEQNRSFTGTQKENLKPSGMVVVCAGEGLSNIFKDLLVDNIIEGGQTMNPSADDIAKAVDKVKAEDVFVFPNNSNIILAVQQAKDLTKRRLHIIPTKNIPQGLSSVLAYNPEASVEENLEAMKGAMEEVKAGLVTYAVRNTQIDDFDLREGDIIGIDSKNILAKGERIDQVTKQLIDKMMDKKVSNITLYFGNDVKEEEAAAIAEEIGKNYTKCDVDIHFGGQPLYYYIVSLS